MPHQIFLSYSSKDEKVMKRILNEFQKANLSVWTMQGIEPGTQSWKRAIEEAIRDAETLVCILSPDALESEWVRAELDFAKAQKKPIYLILARGDESNAVPLGYTTFQWIDIRKKEDFPNLIRLTEILQKRFNIISTPTDTNKTASKTIFVSTPVDQRLSPIQLAVKNRILTMLTGQNFVPLLIGEVGSVLNMPWTFDGVMELMANCDGAIMLGLTRWEFVTQNSTFRFVTEYTHFEGALALANQLPTLLIKENGVAERGIFYSGGGRFIITLPAINPEAWLQSDEFKRRFDDWCQTVKNR